MATAALVDSPAQCAASASFDVAVYRPQQRDAKLQVFEWIDEAFALLRVGGRMCLAGRRNRGVRSYARRLEAVFGNVRAVGREGKLRIYRAAKEREEPASVPVQTAYEFDGDALPGGSYRFCARAGVFSRDGVDPGSRLLAEAVTIRPDARVLDLGCGYGVLGVVAARLAPRGQVRLVDVDVRAVHCAEANLRVNRIVNARAILSDGFSAIPGDRFDLVVSNPPFHAGVAAAHPFVDGAARHLVPTGRMLVVAMRPGVYRRRMREAFHSVADLADREGYTVLEARGPRGQSPGA